MFIKDLLPRRCIVCDRDDDEWAVRRSYGLILLSFPSLMDCHDLLTMLGTFRVVGLSNSVIISPHLHFAFWRQNDGIIFRTDDGLFCEFWLHFLLVMLTVRYLDESGLCLRHFK